MQILINWTLMYQSDGRSWQSFLRLYALRNVTELLSVFLWFVCSIGSTEGKNEIKQKKNFRHGTQKKN